MRGTSRACRQASRPAQCRPVTVSVQNKPGGLPVRRAREQREISPSRHQGARSSAGKLLKLPSRTAYFFLAAFLATFFAGFFFAVAMVHLMMVYGRSCDRCAM
jgi:hypothetical protein